MIFKLQNVMFKSLQTALSVLLTTLMWTSTAQATGMMVMGQSLDRCIGSAADFHDVDPQLLRAILVVESRLNPKAINRNTNGTKDIGVAQINSVHLPLLKVHGIQEDHLLDGCVNTYVGAWLLSKQIARHGLSWFGIAAYHSTTREKNQRYQWLVYNELVRSGVFQNTALGLPPLVK